MSRLFIAIKKRNTEREWDLFEYENPSDYAEEVERYKAWNEEVLNQGNPQAVTKYKLFSFDSTDSDELCLGIIQEEINREDAEGED